MDKFLLGVLKEYVGYVVIQLSFGAGIRLIQEYSTSGITYEATKKAIYNWVTWSIGMILPLDEEVDRFHAIVDQFSNRDNFTKESLKELVGFWFQIPSLSEDLTFEQIHEQFKNKEEFLKTLATRRENASLGRRLRASVYPLEARWYTFTVILKYVTVGYLCMFIHKWLNGKHKETYLYEVFCDWIYKMLEAPIAMVEYNMLLHASIIGYEWSKQERGSNGALTFVRDLVSQIEKKRRIRVVPKFEYEELLNRIKEKKLNLLGILRENEFKIDEQELMKGKDPNGLNIQVFEALAFEMASLYNEYVIVDEDIFIEIEDLINPLKEVADSYVWSSLRADHKFLIIDYKKYEWMRESIGSPYSEMFELENYKYIRVTKPKISEVSQKLGSLIKDDGRVKIDGMDYLLIGTVIYADFITAFNKKTRQKSIKKRPREDKHPIILRNRKKCDVVVYTSDSVAGEKKYLFESIPIRTQCEIVITLEDFDTLTPDILFYLECEGDTFIENLYLGTPSQNWNWKNPEIYQFIEEVSHQMTFPIEIILPIGDELESFQETTESERYKNIIQKHERSFWILPTKRE